jgi:hypothetical protein
MSKNGSGDVRQGDSPIFTWDAQGIFYRPNSVDCLLNVPMRFAKGEFEGVVAARYFSYSCFRPRWIPRFAGFHLAGMALGPFICSCAFRSKFC